MWAADGEQHDTYSFSDPFASGANTTETTHFLLGGYDCDNTLNLRESGDGTNASWLAQPPWLLKTGELNWHETQTHNVTPATVDMPTTWEGHMTFVAPADYPPGTPVIFTFDGVDYARDTDVPLDLSHVTFQGQEPIAYSGSSVSYLTTMSGGESYTLDCGSFGWPGGYSKTSTIAVDPSINYTLTWIESANWFSFGGFGNQRLKATILWGSADVTDTTTNTIVGQRVLLSAAVDAAGFGIQTYQWTVPSKRDADWYADSSSSTEVPLTNTTNSTVSFFWVDGGFKDVSCWITLTNAAGTKVLLKAKTKFEVKRPTASISATINTAGVTVNSDYHEAGTWLHFGKRSSPGIRFCQTNSPPPGFAGDYQFVQLVNPYRTRLLTNGTWQAWYGAGLDSGYPYDTPTDCVLDAPGSPLNDQFLQKSVNDAFQMWLMFKPSGDANWVPLRELDWWWNGGADAGGGWHLTYGANSSAPTDADTTTYPSWNHNAANNVWQ